MNIVVANKKLFDQVSVDFRKPRREWLEPHAVDCGFGQRTWIEAIEGTDGMAGYLTKLSRELTGAQGKDQIPEDAPAHFRRIRASVRTLPPVRRSELTGRMVFCTLEQWVKLTPNQKRSEVTRTFSKELRNHDCDRSAPQRLANALG